MIHRKRQRRRMRLGLAGAEAVVGAEAGVGAWDVAEGEDVVEGDPEVEVGFNCNPKLACSLVF
jgi:hypothetical protein